MSRTRFRSIMIEQGFPVKPRGQFQIHTGLNDSLVRGTLFSMQDMKMLFSSRNRIQIEQVREQLVAAGIRCEIRNFPVQSPDCGTGSYPELWIESNPDYHTASIIYASPIQLLRQQAGTRSSAVESASPRLSSEGKSNRSAQL